MSRATDVHVSKPPASIGAFQRVDGVLQSWLEGVGPPIAQVAMRAPYAWANIERALPVAWTDWWYVSLVNIGSPQVKSTCLVVVNDIGIGCSMIVQRRTVVRGEGHFVGTGIGILVASRVTSEITRKTDQRLDL